MGFKEELLKHFRHGHEKYLRHISIDCVIFGFHDGELKVLLLQVKYAGIWALPGGFILKDEAMDQSAKRILKERTGVDDIFLTQFHTFGDPVRSTAKINRHFLKRSNITLQESWMFDRFITVGYTALVDFTKVNPVADHFSNACSWHNIDDIPDLILDHKQILLHALDTLRAQLNYQPIGYNLLQPKFTMPELQKLYETILDRKLDRRNFQRKIIGTGILKKLNETKKDVAHKAPYLYKFDKKNYKRSLKSGMGFEL